MADQQKESFDVPEDFTTAMRKSLGLQIAEEIRKRCERNIDKNGKRFPKYSKKYIDSLDFSNAGKSSGNVNLQLSGDMLIALDVVRYRKGGPLEVGYKKGDKEMNGKVEGNRLGSYGGSPNKDKARDFLGLPKTVQDKLIRKVRSNF